MITYTQLKLIRKGDKLILQGTLSPQDALRHSAKVDIEELIINEDRTVTVHFLDPFKLMTKWPKPAITYLSLRAISENFRIFGGTSIINIDEFDK